MRITNIFCSTPLFIFVFWLACAGHLVAEETETAGASKEETAATEKAGGKTTVEADQTEIDFQAGMAVLTGNVKVTGPTMTLTSKTMNIYFDDNRNLTELVAEEDVVIEQPEAKRRATSGKAVYDVVTGVITLTKEPRLEMEGGVLENAEKIIYYRDSEKVKTEGGGTITFPSGGDGEGFNFFNRGQPDDAE